MIALVWRLSEYIVMLALHKEVLAMLMPCNGALASVLIRGEVWGEHAPGKFGYLGFLRLFLCNAISW